MLILVSTGYWIVAQDNPVEEESFLRLICIETIGCLHTSLDDDTLDTQFGTDLARYESGGDIVPTGVWNWSTTAVTICDEPLTFNDEPPMVMITEIDGSDDINVQNGITLSNRVYTKIGDGVYVGEEIFGDAATFIQYAQFMIVIDETTMYGIGIGTRQEMDEICPETRSSSYEYLGEQ